MSAVDNIRAALAAGPTPGPWNKTVLDTDMHDKSDSTYVRGMKLDECVFVGAAVTSPTKHVVLAPFDYNDSPEGMCSPNAAYIAACNPAAMTDVLAHIDAQERRIEGYKSQANTDLSMLIRQNSEIERLKADAADHLAELRAYELTVANLREQLAQQAPQVPMKKVDMTRALLEQALVALEGVLDAPVGVAAEFWSCTGGVYEAVECNNAINALRAELAKPAPTQPVQPSCWCARCDRESNTFQTRMAICPLCGDKRCPRAKDHRNECANPKAASAEAKALPEDTK